MLKAEHPDGTAFLADEVHDADLEVSDPHDVDWRCPIGNGPMQFVDAEQRVKHFRHEKPYGHETVPESYEHHYIKRQLQKYWSRQQYVSNVSVEAELGDQIADLLLVMDGGESVVVEIQLSRQSAGEFENRTRHYNDRNFPVLWLVGREKYLRNKSTEHASGKAYTDSLRWLQRQYYGRVYIVSSGKEGVDIIPTRFDPISVERKKWRCVECGQPTGEEYCHRCGSNDTHSETYTKYYDSIATMSTGNLPNRTPFVPERSGEMDYEEFEIVRFYDSTWWT